MCVDFNGYNLHDHKEYLDCGFTRMRGIAAGKGSLIWSNSPRGQPMYAILECAETCDLYFAGHRCNGIVFERDFGFGERPNCQDTLAEAIREYGLTPDDVHDSYNLWMHTELDGQGRRRYVMNRGRKGDRIDLLAVFDTLSVPVICGGDVSAVNSFDLNPMQVQVFAASPGTLTLADQIRNRFGSYRCQKSPADFRQPNILTHRELERDPNYRPAFHPAPNKQELTVSLTEQEKEQLQSLVKTGIYGATAEKALLGVFLKWFDLKRAKDRFVTLEFKQMGHRG